MNKNESMVSIWINLAEKLNVQRPEFGKISIDLFYHQGYLKKAVIIDKTETVIFEKEEKKENE